MGRILPTLPSGSSGGVFARHRAEQAAEKRLFCALRLLRACLRQIGVVYFQQLSGRDESVP